MSRRFFNIKERPYDLLGYVAILLYLLSFIPSDRGALDFNLHDTYFVIEGVSLCRVFAGLLLFLWAMGLLFSNYIWSVKLTWVQVALTIISVIAFLKLDLIGTGLDSIPHRYYAFEEFEQRKRWFSATSIYVSMLLLIVVGQIVFVINVIGGLIKKMIHKSAVDRS